MAKTLNIKANAKRAVLEEKIAAALARQQLKKPKRRRSTDLLEEVLQDPVDDEPVAGKWAADSGAFEPRPVDEEAKAAEEAKDPALEIAEEPAAAVRSPRGLKVRPGAGIDFDAFTSSKSIGSLAK